MRLQKSYNTCIRAVHTVRFVSDTKISEINLTVCTGLWLFGCLWKQIRKIGESISLNVKPRKGNFL